MEVSHINDESVILEEVMSTHDPDGKENFKINVIFDLVKSILYTTTVGESIDDSNGQKSDEEDSNGDKSDEDDFNGEKSEEEDSIGDKNSNDEEQIDMELPYQLKRFSSEISLGMMCPNNVNLHSMVIYFLRMLFTFSWESKLLIMLAAFSLNFGEFSLVHGHNKGLSGKLSILKGRESQVMPMDAHFMKSILHLTEHIIELAQSSSHNLSPIIPIGCYWIVTSILTYASYFTSSLMSIHSGCLISGETQLSSLTIKIKDIISDCRPILEKKREVDSYNALCHAFFDDNPIASTTSIFWIIEANPTPDIREYVRKPSLLKLVFNVKKGGKQKLIYHGGMGEMVKLRLLKNKSLLLLISSSLNIDKYLILLLGYIQRKTELNVLWIPILNSPILWDIKHMKKQYRSLVNEKGLLAVRNVQKSVAPGFVRFVKEKFFPEFQIGGEPIIVSLDQNGRMVHRNAMDMLLMRGLDISERMFAGVKSGDNIIPLLQKVLTERVSTLRDLVPDIDRKISEVTNKVDSIINAWFGDIEKQIHNPVDNNIFTSKKEKDLWKMETWCTKLVADIGYYNASNWIKEDMCIFLIGGHDIQWVKTFESKVMLEIQFNPQSKIEMFYVGSNMKVASMIGKDRNCKVQAAPFCSGLFWARLQSIFMTRIKFIEETHGDEECDEILGRVKKLLAYEANDLVVTEWAMLCKGSKIVVCDIGDKMLNVMNEYEKWKENAIAKGFDQAFKDYHDETMLDSASTSQHHHHRCALKYPCNFDSVPQKVKCPECCHGMQKFVTFKCCHDSDIDLSLCQFVDDYDSD